MPDQFGRPTPEELMFLQQQQAAAQGRMSLAPGMDSGMIMPTRTPEQMAAMNKSFTGEEGKINSQRAMAQQLRGQGMPQGREVGPLNVYQAPNWGESLAGATNILAGAWLGKQANDRDVELDKDRTNAALEKAIYAQDMAKYQNDLALEERDYGREKDKWTMGMEERKQKEVERAALFAEDLSEKELSMARKEMALDAIELEPIQYLRDDGSKLYVGYRLNEGGTAVEPYNLDTGKKVDMGSLTYDISQVGDGKSFNEPIRFVDAKTGDERMISWNKAGYYQDANTGQRLDQGELTGWTPEAAMSESQREAAVAKWVKENSQTLELMHDIDAANTVFARANPDGSTEPPFNWFTKQKGVAGDIFRAIADVGDDDKSQQAAYSAASTVFNAISRIRAGLSQTVNEIERINEETGRNLVVSPEVIVQYWDLLGDKVAADLSRADQTMSPRTMQALQRWRSQKGEQGLTSGFNSSGGTRSGRGIGGQSSSPAPEGVDQADWDYMTPEEKAAWR